MARIDTSINYTNSQRMYVSTTERWLINRILRFKEERPDEVTIQHMPEDNGGYLVGFVPSSWFKITPPHEYHYSAEEKAAMAVRFKQNLKKGKEGEVNGPR